MADVLPFVPPAVKAEMDGMLDRLGRCEDALVQAADVIKDLKYQLQQEKIVKEFYQDLATLRLHTIIELENRK